MPIEIPSTPGAPPVAGPYSSAARAGAFVYLAGQVGIDPATGDLVAGGVGPQARQVLANIAAVLRDCGGGFDDVVKTTIFITDLADFGEVNRIYAEVFGAARPARSTVQVAGLPLGAAVEIEAVIHLPVR